MPTQLLSKLPTGSDVFIDANIFVYGLTGQSAQCQDFLARCAREELFGTTLFEIINEATHRFMLAEAFSRGLITSESSSKLRKHFNSIPHLHAYWVETQRILNLGLLLLTTSETVLHTAQLERNMAGLLTNDSMIVACMREYGIRALATNDADFEHVTGITIYKPDDI